MATENDLPDDLDLYGISVYLKTEFIAETLGLPIEVLQNWRATNVGPPYVKLQPSDRAPVRYILADVVAWEQSVERVIPEDWQRLRSALGQSMPETSGRVAWMLPKQAADAMAIPIQTLTAWRKHVIGIPFIWVGGGGAHPAMYDRRDVEAFIAMREAGPSVVPVIPKRVYRKDSRTPEEQARMSAQIWRNMGYSDEEIRRKLGPRAARYVQFDELDKMIS